MADLFGMNATCVRELHWNAFSVSKCVGIPDIVMIAKRRRAKT